MSRAGGSIYLLIEPCSEIRYLIAICALIGENDVMIIFQYFALLIFTTHKSDVPCHTLNDYLYDVEYTG